MPSQPDGDCCRDRQDRAYPVSVILEFDQECRSYGTSEAQSRQAAQDETQTGFELIVAQFNRLSPQLQVVAAIQLETTRQQSDEGALSAAKSTDVNRQKG